MEVIPTKLHSRKRRHFSRNSHRRFRENEKKNSLSSLLLRQVTESSKSANCAITQNRLTMRLGLFNQGRQSELVIRSTKGEIQSLKNCRKQDLVRTATSDEKHAKKKYIPHSEERFISSPLNSDSSSGVVSAKELGDQLPSSPGFEQLSECLTDHLNPLLLSPDHGYLKGVKSRLSELLKLSLRLAEEDKENAMPSLITPPHSLCRTEEDARNKFQRLSEHSVEAVASASGITSTSAGSSDSERRKRRKILGSGAETNCKDQAASFTVKLNSTKEFCATDNPRFSTNSVLDIIDPRNFLALNDLAYHTEQRATVHSGSSTSHNVLDMPPFSGNTPASTSSTEWMYDIDSKCLRDVGYNERGFTRSGLKQSRLGPDILDIIEGNQASVDFQLPLDAFCHSASTTTAADLHHERDLFSTLPKHSSSQDSLDKLHGHNNHKTYLFNRTRSPSPELKYYRRKHF